MTARETSSRHSLGSDLARVDAHTIQPEEYGEIPELTDEMLARAIVRKGGLPSSLPSGRPKNGWSAAPRVRHRSDAPEAQLWSVPIGSVFASEGLNYLNH